MMVLVKKGFIAEGTTCDSCTEIIRRQAHKVPGVEKISYDRSTEQGFVTFDDTKTDLDTILSTIEEKGYTCYLSKDSGSRNKNIIGWIAAAAGLLLLGFFIFGFADKIALPQISPTMGYVLLFVVGLLTGFHCIAMCGGFVVSYTAKDAKEGRKPHGSHLLYAGGKLLSYTLVGAAFGLLGSIIAFTPTMRGIAGIIAGIFLIVFGLKMLNLIPSLRKLSVPTPRFISRFVNKNSRRGPLVIGLLNGLMIACGPLQAIYVMAAGTGSIMEGAKLLFVFGLGTLPVMLAFGYLTSVISSRWTGTIVKVSGAVVIVLGLFMINNGLALSGSGLDYKTIATSQTVQSKTDTVPLLNQGYQEIHMDVTGSGWSPDTFVLQKGVPVKWYINGKQITSCNNAIQVPKYGLKFPVKQGEQIIEFTPTESGVVPWSCWMGMIQGTFVIKDNVNDTASVQETVDNLPAKKSGTCGGGGSCGCGMM
jgi:uncharacterized protein